MANGCGPRQEGEAGKTEQARSKAAALRLGSHRLSLRISR
jgi:hypothetical protein